MLINFLIHLQKSILFLRCSENSANTCELCKYLDGKIFESYEEVPARPHPNCQCRVEVLEDDYDKLKNQPQNVNEKLCNCIKEINNFIKTIYTLQKESEFIIVQLDNLKDEDFKLLNEIKKIKLHI